MLHGILNQVSIIMDIEFFHDTGSIGTDGIDTKRKGFTYFAN